MNRLGREHLGGMSNEGAEVQARRENLGWDKVDLADAAQVSRNTIAAIERGDSFNRTTLAKIQRALDEAEAEAGINAPAAKSTEEGLVEFEVDGSRVIVRGPVANADELAAMVADLIKRTRESE